MSERVSVVQVERGRVIEVDWKRVSVRREIATCAATFDFEAVGIKQTPLRVGQLIEIRYGGTVVMRGHIEEFEVEVGDGERKVGYGGRELTGDLVDSSAPVAPVNFFENKVALQDLVEHLANPHNITVRDKTDGYPPIFTQFAVRPDETCWGAIERAARMRGRIVQGDGLGGLEIVEAGASAAIARLAFGQNVIRARFRTSSTERFRIYEVLGQRGSSGGSGWTPLAGFKVIDTFTKRPRRLVVIAESACDTQTSKERAEWEATVRAARSTTVEVVVPSWRQIPYGEDFETANKKLPLWEPNLRVNVQLPELGVDTEMLVQAVAFEQSRDGGTVTTLELTRKNAYKVLVRKDGTMPDDNELYRDAMDNLGVPEDVTDGE